MNGPTVAVDHFAGLGWGVACQRLGVREYGVEIAPSAIRMRSANGMRTIYRDVWSGLFRPDLVPEHDLYIASPPCQTFSMAGKGEGRKALDDVQQAIFERRFEDPAALHDLTETLDPRTALVLTPLAHIWAHRPRLIALEQVPEVLPVWHAYAAVLRSIGYSVWAGILRAEQYGVPQTRKRAILMARLDGKVDPPAPTHSRFYETNRDRLDQGVEKWVSMAEALGWGMTQRPYPTIATARATGGPDKEKVGGSGARKTIYDELEAGRWVYVNGNQANAARRPADCPAPTVHFGAALNDVRWQGSGGVDPRLPATTVAADPRLTSRGHHGHGDQGRSVPSAEVREAFKVMGAGMVQRHGERPARSQNEPAFTIRANAGGAEPGGFRIREVGDGADPRGVRVSLEEAATLQSFPSSTVWMGTQTQRFTVVGNAVPPLMAEAILAALIAPPAERDAWDNVFAEVAG